MIKQLQTRILMIIVLSGILLNSCEKEEIYDLFPLKVGNEFYYKYYKKRLSGISATTNGTEVWKVIVESPQGDSILYIIERKLNATTIIPGLGDTIQINNSISQLAVSEKKSSSLISIFGFRFKRYQDISQIELKQEGYSSTPSITCVFKSDSGLVKYYYHHPPNQIYDESLILDSLKVLP
ncbi:MAG: hypothetical protein AB9846_07605 [Tenuifilaceae bacterium]